MSLHFSEPVPDIWILLCYPRFVKTNHVGVGHCTETQSFHCAKRCIQDFCKSNDASAKQHLSKIHECSSDVNPRLAQNSRPIHDCRASTITKPISTMTLERRQSPHQTANNRRSAPPPEVPATAILVNQETPAQRGLSKFSRSQARNQYGAGSQVVVEVVEPAAAHAAGAPPAAAVQASAGDGGAAAEISAPNHVVIAVVLAVLRDMQHK